MWHWICWMIGHRWYPPHIVGEMEYCHRCGESRVSLRVLFEAMEDEE